MTPREVLLKAAEHIERYGHGKGYLGYENGPCCARGAMAIVAAGHCADQDGANALLVSYLGLELPIIDDASEQARRRSAIYRWNDAPGRTTDEVIAALRGAAESAPC